MVKKVVAQAEAAVKEGTASADIPVSQPRLWDADIPNCTDAERNC